MSDNYIIVNGELYHWGVKGMRWGVRRTDAQLGHPKKSSDKKDTPKSKPDTTKKKRAAIIGASVAAALAVAGGITVAVIMNRNGGKGSAPVAKGSKMVSTVMKKIGKTPVNRVPISTVPIGKPGSSLYERGVRLTSMM